VVIVEAGPLGLLNGLVAKSLGAERSFHSQFDMNRTTVKLSCFQGHMGAQLTGTAKRWILSPETGSDQLQEQAEPC